MKAPRISRQRSVRTDDPVARDQDPYRIMGICRRHGAYGPGIPQPCSELSIGNRASKRDLHQGFPNLFLKCRPLRKDRNVKLFEMSLKIGVHLFADLAKGGGDKVAFQSAVSNGNVCNPCLAAHYQGGPQRGL